LLLSSLAPSIQLGDFGLFNKADLRSVENIPLSHTFIRGNHDNPEICTKVPNYLGDFGFYDEEKTIFFVSGAYSVDQSMRIPFVEWWPDEELSAQQMNDVMSLIRKHRPTTILSHAAPQSLIPHVVSTSYTNTSPTERLFEDIFQQYPPDLWVAAHYHQSFDRNFKHTRFVVLDELETIEV
jgi:hypothetical protein